MIYRKFKQLIIVFIIVLSISISSLAFANQIILNDIDNHWAEREIQLLTVRGIISGFEDGSYRPDESVTRSQMIKLIIAALGYESDALSLSAIQGPYDDISDNHWAKGYINVAWELGILNRDKERFRPDENITRLEMTRFVIRALEFKGIESQNSSNKQFADINDLIRNDRNYINAAANMEIIMGMPDNTFRPGESATRAQTAVIVKRMLSKTGETYDIYGIIKNYDNNRSVATMSIQNDLVQLPVNEDAYIYKNLEKASLNNILPLYEGFVAINEANQISFIDLFYYNDYGVVLEIDRNERIIRINSEDGDEKEIFLSSDCFVLQDGNNHDDLNLINKGNSVYIVYEYITGRARIIINVKN